MGSTQSSEVNSFIDSCVNVTMNVINQNITNNHIECVAMNNMTITFGPTSHIVLKNGMLKIGQTANVQVCDMSSAISTTVNNDFQTNITNQIDSLIDQAQSATTGFAATAFSNQQAKQNFKASIHTAISKTFNNTNISTCAASATAINNSTIELNGYLEIDSGNIDISQQALVSATAKCIVNNVISNIDQDTIDSITKSVQKTDQTATLNGFFESMGNMLKGLMLPIIIAIVACVVLGGLFLVIKMSGGSGSISSPKSP